MADAPKLKDYFTAELLTHVGGRIQRECPSFDVEQFVADAMPAEWDELTFTQRSQSIGDAIWSGVAPNLNNDPVAVLDTLTRVLPEPLDDPEGVLNEGFWLWPFGDLIATYAVDHLDAGLDACEALTQRFTSEFAVRPFLARYPEALDRAIEWTNHPSEHVRRLASEGTRPRLPWAKRLDLPVDKVLELLSNLRADESLYVRKSVGNHLNDLAKDDSDRIVTLLEQWMAEDVPETNWIVRHALRNHLKNGDPRVLALFGYGPPSVDEFVVTVTPELVAMGESIEIEFDLTDTSGSDQKLMVDLVVGYMKANGTPRPKVFKFKDTELAGGKTLSCSKKLGLIPRNTRKLYPGEHSVTVRVNGKDLATADFVLTD